MCHNKGHNDYHNITSSLLTLPTALLFPLLHSLSSVRIVLSSLRICYSNNPTIIPSPQFISAEPGCYSLAYNPGSSICPASYRFGRTSGYRQKIHRTKRIFTLVHSDPSWERGRSHYDRRRKAVSSNHSLIEPPFCRDGDSANSNS